MRVTGIIVSIILIALVAISGCIGGNTAANIETQKGSWELLSPARSQDIDMHVGDDLTIPFDLIAPANATVMIFRMELPVRATITEVALSDGDVIFHTPISNALTMNITEVEVPLHKCRMKNGRIHCEGEIRVHFLERGGGEGKFIFTVNNESKVFEFHIRISP